MKFGFCWLIFSIRKKKKKKKTPKVTQKIYKSIVGVYKFLLIPISNCLYAYTNVQTIYEN